VLTNKSSVQPLQAFILEPILTPSGFFDGGDHSSDLAIADIDPHQLSDLSFPSTDHQTDAIIVAPEPILEHPADLLVDSAAIEPIPFIQSLEPLHAPPVFDSGVFLVGDTGQVSVDFLFDGGGYQGELAIFSLHGMENFEPGSHEFIQEAAHRALSNTDLGHIVIHDQTEGAAFSGNLGEENVNFGNYQGIKAVGMRPGDTFGIMLVPNGTVQQLFDNPSAEGDLHPLFSMTTANPNQAFHLGQIADVTGNGHTFVMEDLRTDSWTDRDYNDLIFQVKGATGTAVHLDQVIDPAHDWTHTDLGQELLDYASLHEDQPTITSAVSQVQTDLVPEVDRLLEQIHSQLAEIIANPSLANADIDPAIDHQGDLEIANLEAELERAIAELTNDPFADANVVASNYEFPLADQPLVGVIDTGFADIHPDIDGSILLGHDFVDGDNNPLLPLNTPDAEHGTKILEVIAATQNNNLGIDGVNDDAPLWLGRSVGSGNWADSLTEFVDAAKASHQPHAIVNLSFDLTEVQPDGSIATRLDLTAAERAALTYAHDNGVLVVAAAGNQGTAAISALGRASQEFDNIITVGAFDGSQRADYSSYGAGLDLLAYGTTPAQVDAPPGIDLLQNLTSVQREALEKALQINTQLSSNGTTNLPAFTPEDQQAALAAAQQAIANALGEINNSAGSDNAIAAQEDIAGTSIASAKVTGAAAQVWAANPHLSFAQVKEILKGTAVDLGTPGWDAETGTGLLDLAAAVQLALVTNPNNSSQSILASNADIWNDGSLGTPGERPAGWWDKVKSFFKKVGNVITKVVNVVTKVIDVVKKVFDFGKKVWDFFAKAGGIFSKIKSFFSNIVCKFICLPLFGKLGIIFGGVALVAGAIGGLILLLKKRKQQPPSQPAPEPIPQDILNLQGIWNNLNPTQKNDLRNYLLNGLPAQYRNLLDGSPASDRTIQALTTLPTLPAPIPPELGTWILTGSPATYLPFFNGTSPTPDPSIPATVVTYWNGLTSAQKQGLIPALTGGIPVGYRPLFQGDPDKIQPVLNIVGSLQEPQRSLLWKTLAASGGVPDQYHSFFP